MIKFKDKRINEIKYAYSIEKIENKMIVQFEKNGKKYTYDNNNIELLTNEDLKKNFIVYKFKKQCYQCQKETTILTYLKFKNGDDLIYPWNKNRLNKEKSFEESMLHLEYPQIEWYPINVIGSDEELDEIMLKKFPDNIKEKYSSTQKRMYPMNICEKCGAKQGEFFIYRDLNKKIQQMEKIDIYGKLD